MCLTKDGSLKKCFRNTSNTTTWLALSDSSICVSVCMLLLVPYFILSSLGKQKYENVYHVNIKSTVLFNTISSLCK